MDLAVQGRFPRERVVVVEYPGHVVNCDRAIDTLGGIAAIQQVAVGNGSGCG